MGTDISIIIPAYNEAKKIRGDISAAAGFLKENSLQGEILVIDDGSSDGTAEIAADTKILPGIDKQVVSLPVNRGKGFAVKRGVAESSGDVVLFADSGLCIPYDYCLPALKKIAAGELDLAHASRKHRDTVILVNRSLKRRLVAWFFHWFAVLFAGLPATISDSQCGFKLYNGGLARELFQLCVSDQWLCDLEFLLRALKLGCRVEEFPITWSCDRDSKLHPFLKSRQILKEFLIMRKSLKESTK